MRRIVIGFLSMSFGCAGSPLCAWAEGTGLPVKQGTSLCQLGECSLTSIPRLSGGPAPAPIVTVPPATSQPAKHTGPGRTQASRRSSKSDRIRISQAAPSWAAGDDDRGGNLPGIYHGVSWKDFEASSQAVIITPQTGAKMSGVRKGDVLAAVIEDEIEVWPGAASPVRAFVTKGPYRGAIVSGDATMDPARKKVMIAFDRLRMPGGGDLTYALKAQVRDATGRYGLAGDYHSESGLFFIGEMVASTAAGFTDATIQRSQTAQGTYVQEPSLANAAKSGAVTALSRRADRFAQAEGRAPEWTELAGYQEVQIFIQVDPTEDNG